MNRNTFVIINIKNIMKNIKTLLNKYNNYKYHLAVVKADSYGHGCLEIVKNILKEKIDYLVVATLEEALEIRREFKKIPILCLGLIKKENINICKKNNITITINNINYLKDIENENLENLFVHIKINTGMNRLGINNKKDLLKAFKILKEKDVNIEGIFTHIYSPQNIESTNIQIDKFINITNDIDLSKIKIVHLFASDAMEKYPILNFVNGCRFGINMYGLGNEKLLSTFKVISEVIQINNIKADETVGYNAIYQATETEKIAVVAIGYADGIIRKYTGSYVYINNRKYQIVGNICMDMLFVKVDNRVKIGDKVVIIKDNKHIREISKHLNTIPYEIICNISKRVPRKYI